MRSFALSLMLAGAAALATPAVADEANPDAGKLARIFCFSVTTNGIPTTREPDFSIILQQVPNGELDASFFVPGNRNLDEPFPPTVPFRITVYRDGQLGSTFEDYRDEAAVLFETAPSLDYLGVGQRRVDRYYFWLDSNGTTGAINYIPEMQNISVYNNHEEGDSRGIYCEAPYAVDAE